MEHEANQGKSKYSPEVPVKELDFTTCRKSDANFYLATYIRQLFNCAQKSTAHSKSMLFNLGPSTCMVNNCCNVLAFIWFLSCVLIRLTAGTLSQHPQLTWESLHP